LRELPMHPPKELSFPREIPETRPSVCRPCGTAELRAFFGGITRPETACQGKVMTAAKTFCTRSSLPRIRSRMSAGVTPGRWRRSSGRSPDRRVVRAANRSAQHLQVALNRRRFIEEALAERRDLRGEAVQTARVPCERLRGFLQLLLRLLGVRLAA